MKAIWNNHIIAESDDTVLLEGNHYFPPESVNAAYVQKSDTHTTCPYKGIASYYSLQIDGQQNVDAAWYYPEVKRGYEKIKGRVAFWRGVVVED